MSELEIRQFPCLSDNYGFLVHDPASGETAAIDTPDADAYLAAAADAGWFITQIWNTHHHFDHAGGNAALKAATGARVIAPEYDRQRIDAADQWVTDGDRLQLGTHTADIVYTPGHTMGHVVYHFAKDRLAFVGDTLFALGCGRLFEGSPSDMWTSLSKLRAWPDNTVIYCAHEYTEANAAFALSVDSGNPDLKAYASDVAERRSRGRPTVPTTIGKEKAANPFLRPDDPALAAAVGMAGADPVEVFAEVRRRKDQF
ncbi:hydroxyacylglutathione hydrolase [Hyphobacterium sp. HN65]|uniref:Hydroxyacylglutathione hydrolase n=1 Tax=Hyphobacterium lacteum TaxID=3116575 RepID=A0ABU7LQ11_9PROT|nr:hydroxyacylglutathione hydrolase [Hyphobacterium sp. HN65]MEE2525996.1 hydroxyacylglutathione hydrolase [Hyphobacterium sp. HN65]